MTRQEAKTEIEEEFKIFLESTSLDDAEILEEKMKKNAELRKVVEANRMAIKALEQEPKMGYWKKGDYWSDGCGMGENYGYYYECSNCGETVQDDYLKCSYSYCPYCGAKMIEPQESEDKE